MKVKPEPEKPKAYTIKYKRPRGSRACTVCRARKVRCDAEIHIPCTNCITFGCNCVLPEMKKRGSNDKRRRKDEEEDVPAEAAAAVPKPAPPPLSANPVPSAPGFEPIHNISQISVPPSLTLTYKNRPSMHKRELLASKAKLSLTFIGSLSISLMTKPLGQNHVVLQEDLFEMPDNLMLDLVELEILKMRGAFLLPSTELARDLVELYFDHVHPLMPVINKTEFMAKFNDPDDSPSLMLLQAVLLCGLRVSNNPLLFDNKGLSNLALLTFFRRAKALYETNYESDPVLIVQTVILIGSYWVGPEDVTRNSFYWTRVGVGLAQGFGFHRDVTYSTNLSTNEKKIWRRIWWCLFEKDRNVAIAFGRPPTIDLADCDVRMLSMDDFDENDPENDVVSPYPLNETQALYFIHLVKLAEITGIIIKYQYTVKAELIKRVSKFTIIQRCDMLMGIWFTNLPPQLQFSLTNSSKQNFYGCLLNAQYYNRLYLIHRANLLRMARSSSTNPNNYKYPSWGISFQAARMISIVSKIILDKGMIKDCPVMFVYILFSALMMLIYHIDSSNSVIASAASDSLFITRGVLKELGKYWPIVLVLLKLFDKQANDKIKRAKVIERETRLHEQTNSHSNTGVFDQTPNHSPLGFQKSPKESFVDGFERADNIPMNEQGLERLIRQYKQKPAEEQTTDRVNDNAFPPKSASDSTLSPPTNFPDILLVTDQLNSNPNFIENFEPTQLFPNENISYPPSRAGLPPNNHDLNMTPKNGNSMADSQNPFPSGLFRSSTSLNDPDPYTNFMDSEFINMNFQASAEDDAYLKGDLASMIGIPP